jgi:predicted RNase H-like HicB family nuclease
MSNAMRFTVSLEPQPEGGFTAQCIEVPGAISQGETAREALDNVQEANHLILEVRREAAMHRPNARIETVEVDA